jgi:hypothetical protein
VTQFFAYANSALGNTHIRLNGSVHDGVPGVTQNADGTFATGGVTIDDPTGAFSFIELQQFTYDETACSRQRVFTGYLSNMRVSRGPYVTGPGRIYDFDLLDLNYLLHLRPLRGTDAKRPVETGNARLAWLLSSIALDGIVYDHGFVGSNANTFDAADYTDQYSEAVLSDLCVSSSTEIGRIFFVYRDNTTGQPSLFIDIPTVTTYTSTLSISNTNSDRSATCFAPFKDAELSASGEDIYCGVIFKYKTGQVYRHNDTTHATYFAGTDYHREAVFETTRVGSLDTATRHADAFLANHAGTIDTVTCMIQVPSASVNLLEAGMRVSCKFSDLQGYEGPIYLRVSSRTVVPTAGNPDLYDLHLTLSNKSLTPVGGGGTGGFPNPPPSPPSPLQHKGGGGTVNLDDPVADGQLIVIMASARGGYPTTPSGFAIERSNTNVDIDPGSGNQGFMRMYSKVAASETGAYGAGSASTLEVVTYPAGTTINATAIASAADDTVVLTITPSAAGATVMGFAAYGWFFDPTAIVPVSGLTTLDDLHATNPPWNWSAYKSVSTPAATTLQGTYGGIRFSWGGIVAVLLGTADQNPPTTGRWVYNELVTLTAGAGTTEFPFATGALRVRYDIVDQTPAIVSTNGATGGFVMPSQPPLGTQVFVDYQAI